MRKILKLNSVIGLNQNHFIHLMSILTVICSSMHINPQYSRVVIFNHDKVLVNVLIA